MKKRIILFVMAALLLTGCTRRADVRLRLVVHAIGIDIEDDVYSVAYQVFTAQPPEGGGPVDATQSNVMTMVSYGRTIYEAQKNLEFQTGKEVFIGDVELIVLGLSLVERDISETLSYFWDNTDIYMGVNVAFADGKAADVVGVGIEQGTATTELLTEMIIASSADGSSIPARLIEISNRLEERGASLVVPVLTAKKADNSGGKEDTNIYDMALGVFRNMLVKDKKPIVYVTKEETKGISILTDRANDISLELAVDGKRAAVAAKLSKIKRKIRIGENGYPVIKVYVKGTAVITENSYDVSEESLRVAAQEEIIRLCSLGYEKSVSAHSADVLEIGKLLRKYCNKYYKASENDFEDVVKNTSFEINADLDMHQKE